MYQYSSLLDSMRKNLREGTHLYYLEREKTLGEIFSRLNKLKLILVLLLICSLGLKRTRG